MRVTIDKNDLVKAIAVTIKAVPVRTTMDILQCLLIDAKKDGIYLIANNLDLAIETRIEGRVDEEGVVAIKEVNTFSDLCKQLPEGNINISTDDDFNSLVTSENKSCKIKGKITGLSPDNFSYLPEVERESHVTMSQLALKDVINQTIFSLALNDINPMMTGELFEIKDSKLRVVALDSHRISLRNIELGDLSSDINVYSVIPGKSLKEIASILINDSEKYVDIYFGSSHVLFETEGIKIVSRLLEGKYFNVDQMFSTDSETRITVNKKAFINAIDAMTVFISESDRRPVIFDIKDGIADIHVKTTRGEAQDELEIKKDGADIKIAFNPKFLTEALKVIEDEEILISFVNSKSPCFIKDNEETYLYLILPVNFTEE